MTEREPGVPVDPSGIEEPHDVLAADEFGIGTRDERLPPDPNRFDPPHDILAAEEFAIPAGGESHTPGAGSGRRVLIPLMLVAALAALVLVRRRT
jgi:MYXO-CTERM domain-containing protein